MAFKKGEKIPGQGKRGPNKTTLQLKEMILAALDGVGGIEYLERRANDPKTASAFLTLVGKVLPMTVAGDPNNPLQVKQEWRVTFHRAEPDATGQT